jgi:hypothetical protein
MDIWFCWVKGQSNINEFSINTARCFFGGKELHLQQPKTARFELFKVAVDPIHSVSNFFIQASNIFF